MNKPVSFIAYHGSVEDNLELEPNKAFYLCASYKLAKEFAYREVYRDGLYEGDVPMIYKFKGTFKNPYYMTEEEYDDEGQDSNIDFQKWVDMGVDGIVIPNRQTYYVVIDPSTIRLIGKKYLPFDEESLERTDDRINDKDDIIGENVEYKDEVEILLNPSTNEFKHFMKPNGWYRMCLTNDKVIVWDANTSILHQDVDNEYGLENSEHIFIHKGKPYLQDYDLDDYLENEMDSVLFVAKQIDNNPMFKRYFPNHSMEVDIHKAIDNDGKYIVEEYEGLNRIAGFYWFDEKKFQMLKRKPIGVKKLDSEDDEFDYYHLDDNGLEEDNKARFGIENIGQKLVCYIEAEDKQKCLIAKKAIQRKFNDILIDKFQLSWGRNNFEELYEEMVHVTKKDLSDVILKNPTRQELKEYSNITDWRIIQDVNGNYYFADAMVYLHSWMVKALLSKNIDVVNADEDNYGIMHYTVAYNTFFYRLLGLIDREDVIKEYNNSYLKNAFPNAQFIRNYDDREEFNEQYISESVFDYGTPMIFPDPSYSEFHRIMRDHTTYGKLSAIIDKGHIYCWDSGMAHHHQMIKHIENQIGERLSDNAIWVRFKEPNWVWVSAEYFNEYDDDELDDLEQQDFEKALENNPIIKKYFPRGTVIKRFNNLVESFKKVSDDSYVMEITSYNDIKPFIQRYCSFGARGLLNTNNNKVYLADVMALTHGDMVNDLKENGESIDYNSVIQFMVYPSQETALDSEYAEYWNEGDDRIQFVTNDDIYVLFKQYNFMNDRLNKILKMNTMDDVEREDDMNGFVITESIHFNDMAYNNAFNKFEELTVWKNPSIDWLQDELENIDLRFIYNPDANMLYVWNGSKWMHSEVMDNVDMKMSSNVNIIGVLSPSVVEIWAEISPNDNANEAKSLTRKYMGKLLKDIYPDGYQLIAYT